mmetsp:Transcript_31824/g.46632  ORF Transcript_31824/g.46632 Transcript_31824/m.46632 type:complete len:654 (-) Transcript_31824:830-2791(-)
MPRPRIDSFAEIDESQASAVLTKLLQENNVMLGGSSMGRGLKRAARFYIQNGNAHRHLPNHFDLPGANDLNPDVLRNPTEESFYVVDIGVIVSQLYQWRKYFPRVEPFYAVKCNPDPVIVRSLAILGANFDCASRSEYRLVQQLSSDLPRNPDIIYANPCKARAHILEAVCKGVKLMTFDNVAEVVKCASISKKIQLVLRIVTDDRGAQCRLSSKFGAPRTLWRPLLSAAKKHGMQVVGVSFHVGSGCRDAQRYEAALEDARELFEIAEKEFGYHMTLLDIGGGFPGETHSFWNPAAELDDPDEQEDEEEEAPDVSNPEGLDHNASDNDRFMFFTEIAEQVAPMIDRIFPVESGIRVIAEPGRYFAASAATLFTSVISIRSNATNNIFAPQAVDDEKASQQVDQMTREDEENIVRERSISFDKSDDVIDTIREELSDYSKLYAKQNLATQETDVYNDGLDLYKEDFETASNLLGPPDDEQKMSVVHTVEGMNTSLATAGDTGGAAGILTLAAAGEAAVSGILVQAVADSAPLQDDFSYYVNDGVYGAFNNIMFDHATVRPRVLRGVKPSPANKATTVAQKEGEFIKLKTHVSNNDLSNLSDSENDEPGRDLFASTVFGPTCDSIDVIARSVLLPKLKVGDWLYFQVSMWLLIF